ncbi:MAG TPA: hypothetical protein VEY91_03490 [Candidatus Limnocylindria bacterium]|nr:hypothetical protein [Candidatus Limnocylindria bacterium]
MELLLQPTVAGAAFAGLAVAGGAPWFGDGLRTLRLRRHLKNLVETPLAELPTGMVHVRGRVTLESPLFAPLSGQPCAGFRLEVETTRGQTFAIDERRPFRLVTDESAAHVFDERAEWLLAVSAEREVASREAVSSHLEALLSRSAEARWARGIGQPLRLVERMLAAGAECHVVGYARQSRPFELPAEIEWARTGTDDRHALLEGRRTSHEPDLWIDGGGHLEFMLVSDRAPSTDALRIGAARMIGLAGGPLVSLGGLVYLAHAADQLRAAGRF